MTRTESQLREALSHLAAVADAPAAPPAAVRAPRRCTALVLAVATVLVTAVAAVALTVARAASDPTSAPPLRPSAPAVTSPTASPSTVSRVAGSASPLFAWFTLDAASGWTITELVHSATVQTGYVALPQRKAYVDVSLYRAGAFDPTSAETGTAITVQGTAGWRGPVTDRLTQRTLTSDVWQWAPGAWAVVAEESTATEAVAAADALSVAEAVRVADPTTDVDVPFTIERLPAGLSPDVVSATPGDDPPGASIGFADDRAGDPGRAQADGGALTVRFDSHVAPPTGAPTTRVDGHPAWLSSTSGTPSGASSGFVPAASRDLVVDYGGSVGYGLFSVDARHLDRYGNDVLLALAAATTPVADVADVGTWVPAASGALR